MLFVRLNNLIDYKYLPFRGFDPVKFYVFCSLNTFDIQSQTLF